MEVYGFILIFFSACAHADEEVSCVYLGDCVLHHSFTPGSDLDNPNIRWTKTEEGLTVHSFHHGQNQELDQYPDYSGRTSLFEEEINRGNGSLLLKQVTVRDQGRYLCRADGQVAFVIMKVFAPVLEVHVGLMDDKLVCQADHIYPQPAVTWTMSPEPPTKPPTNTSMCRSETGLFSVNSSVPLPLVPYQYSCNVSTAYSWQSNTYKSVSSFEVDVAAQGSELVCRSEGVYPEPTATWSTGLSESEAGRTTRTTVRQREDQLYDLHSSVPLQPTFTAFSCNVSTALYWKSTKIAEEYPLGVFYSDAVLRCAAFKAPSKVQTQIWTFNHTQRIVSRAAGSEPVYNESWRSCVDALTDSNSLVLKDLTLDQEGFYSCLISSRRRTTVTVIHLKIQLMQLYLQVSEETAAELEVMSVWIIGALFIFGFSLCCFKEKGQR